MASSSSSRPKPKRLTPSTSGGKRKTDSTDDDDSGDDLAPPSLPALSRTSTLPIPKNSAGLRSRSVSPVKRVQNIFKHEEYNASRASLLSNASFLPDTPSPLLPPDLQKLKAFRSGNPNGELGDDDSDDDDGDEELGPDASVVDKAMRLIYKNSGILLMLAAQVFASAMSVITRLLETGFDTEFYSLAYLDISDATVITFLAPSVAGVACWVILKEPFTKVEMLAGFISLMGVVLIARPTSLFYLDDDDDKPSKQGSAGSGGTEPSPSQDGIKLDLKEITSAQRFTAVLVALVGVLGAATAYTTIRWIGKRAHPLISVNYFSVWCSIVSFLGLLVIPGIGFKLPQTFIQWTLLVGIGICGFCMQFLLTAALQRERAGLVTHMVYAQMIFALIWDKALWNTLPSWTSWLGSFMILGSAVYVAVQKNKKKNPANVSKREARARRHVQSEDEERGLVGGKGSDDEEDSEDGSSLLDEDESRALEVERGIQMQNLGRLDIEI
ncbi:hypothetical protein H072_8983 [Dactylellina haptotyla CBS 200.50]|uniref:EamA domain-containing protein n=1 Tax=Dactylellina haptotyla (strain CBS 200.50) TaxID=1284197 RepID=S8BQ55_DACHA|nr:hypothetical protein H072_8983 [Dactylellina haptotyla CBS 200.50]